MVQGFLEIDHEKLVLSKNADDGAYLLSTKPAPVILENIYAYENKKSGINLRTDGGSITIKNVQAGLNQGIAGDAGLKISNNLGSVLAPVTITNGRFNNNYYDGLSISSKGNVTLTNVSATDNFTRGVTIQNYEGAGNVTIKSSLIGDYYDFSRNGNIGIEIYTSGAVPRQQCVRQQLRPLRHDRSGYHRAERQAGNRLPRLV